MASSFDSIGFIGLGVMGLPMLENLIKKLPDGTKYYVYDVSTSAMDTLCAQYPEKVHACANSREVADKSVASLIREPRMYTIKLTRGLQQSVILSMVPEGSHVRAVYLTPDTGVLSANIGNKLLIDCSTIDTATSLEVRAAAQALSPPAHFYDAPVSGGQLGAQKATLTFMLGCAARGDDANRARIHSLLATMGAAVFACGGPSLGLTAKLCNNYCSGLIAIATSEAMNIGIAAGMDPRVLRDVFHASTAQSAILDKWCPVPGVVPGVPSSDGYRGGFKVQLMRKDFGLAVDAARRLGVRLALGEAGLETYTATMKDPRFWDLDSRVVYRYLGGRDDWKKDFDDVD
ncbi:putative 3-hydroxyisobutyrate mitochondrial precursor [Diplodia seriata]|uniref:3-hydroxyisobutyrate dehydrogenase n=1 Tax=Diplodia seriata TaxID=420778 RepID=A0A0G2GTV6_9PEZI|nr:putative 3-hydroxyisobutyrate mitochondrial precursor [Diplodia seriata]